MRTRTQKHTHTLGIAENVLLIMLFKVEFVIENNVNTGHIVMHKYREFNHCKGVLHTLLSGRF